MLTFRLDILTSQHGSFPQQLSPVPLPGYGTHSALQGTPDSPGVLILQKLHSECKRIVKFFTPSARLEV